MKILVAEDNAVLRMIHQEQLTAWGYDFDLAVNGEEAVDYARKNGRCVVYAHIQNQDFLVQL